ncbi:MAG: O-antigen ligase family protein [Magnetospirillum sp.]|nr:O-antigen ligase family protein [Magnetospirillum sp.]
MRIRRLSVTALVLVFTLSPFVVVPFGRSLAWIPALIAIAALIDATARRHAVAAGRAVVPVLLPLLVYLAVSLLWTPVPVDAAVAWGRVTVLAIAMVLGMGLIASLDSDERNTAAMAVLRGGMLLSGLLLAGELYFHLVLPALRSVGIRLSDDSRNHLNNACAALAVLFWPLVNLAMVRRGPTLATGVFIFGAFALIQGNSLTPLMSAIGGGLAFAAVVNFGRRAVSWLVGLAVGALVAMPVVVTVVLEILSPRRLIDVPWHLQHRLRIWRFALSKWREHPLGGWGFDSSRAIPGASDPLTGLSFVQYAENMPLHPHNNIIQLWLEGGLIGVVLFAVFLALLGGRIRRLEDPRQMGYASATVTTFLLLGSISFGMWQNWWLATAVLAIVVLRLGQMSTGEQAT